MKARINLAFSPDLIRKVLREPFLHFLIIGLLFFSLVADPDMAEPADDEGRIIVSSAEVKRMIVAWTQRWHRPPTSVELDGMIREAVREQVLYREALALGLDRDDVVIRRHLRQKYEFLTQDLAYDTDPNDDTLRAYYAAQPDRYTRSARVSFRHILFSPDRRGETAAADAAQAMADLQLAPDPQAADLFGDPTSLPADFAAMSDIEVEAMFGPDFAAALLDLEPGQWAGPITSGYGLHLVWLSEKVPDATLKFEEVTQRIKDDWVYDQRTKANEAVYRRLLDRYEVVVESPGSAVPPAGDRS